MHLYEEEWLSGIRSGMKDLFEIRDDDDADDKSDEIEEKDEENYDNINGFDLNDTADLELSERGEQFAQYWIRKNPFEKFLRRVGKERAQKLSRLTVTWGTSEGNQICDWTWPGAYAVGIMSIVCSLFLPNLKHVTLQQTVFDYSDTNGFFLYRVGTNFGADTEKERWPDHMKSNIMTDDNDEYPSSPEPTMTKAIRLMIAACGSLKLLELKDWHLAGRVQWWEEALKKEGLVVKLQILVPPKGFWLNGITHG